jgi:hypothetical protein
MPSVLNTRTISEPLGDLHASLAGGTGVELRHHVRRHVRTRALRADLASPARGGQRVRGRADFAA